MMIGGNKWIYDSFIFGTGSGGQVKKLERTAHGMLITLLYAQAFAK